jgi:hypothetical protein
MDSRHLLILLQDGCFAAHVLARPMNHPNNADGSEAWIGFLREPRDPNLIT